LNTDQAALERIVLRLHRDGLTGSQVAQLLQNCGATCTTQDVERVILGDGIPQADVPLTARSPARTVHREANRSLAQCEPDDLRVLADRFLNGESMRDIAEELGVHQNRLAKSLKDEGLLPDMNLQKLRKLQRRKTCNGEGREP
jgi:DNA-directed RNA polymerase specialized sigma24 family protein